MLRPITLGLALGACIVAGSPSANAFERQWHAGGGLGIAALPGSDYTVGPMLGLHGAYGISDVFDIKLELGGSYHVLPASQDVPRQSLTLYSAAAGLSYKIDVFEWVPYFALLLGGYAASAVPLSRDKNEPSPFKQRDLAASSALGLDYYLSRGLVLGGELRYSAFLGELTGPSYDTQLVSLLLRVEAVWGW
ncbi:MAG TPA: outer membrane beta-barrel protein [Polyangiaceae bacterium]|jgi:hypothetical protein